MRFGIAFVVCWNCLKRLILVGSRRGALEFDAIYAFVRNFGSSFPPPFFGLQPFGIFVAGAYICAVGRIFVVCRNCPK